MNIKRRATIDGTKVHFVEMSRKTLHVISKFKRDLGDVAEALKAKQDWETAPIATDIPLRGKPV